MNTLRKSSTVIADTVDGSTMLCETNTVSFFRLNKTGAYIWDICDNKSIDQIVALLADTYPEMKAKALKSEVEKFVRLLAETELVTLNDATDSRS